MTHRPPSWVSFYAVYCILHSEQSAIYSPFERCPFPPILCPTSLCTVTVKFQPELANPPPPPLPTSLPLHDRSGTRELAGARIPMAATTSSLAVSWAVGVKTSEDAGLLVHFDSLRQMWCRAESVQVQRHASGTATQSGPWCQRARAREPASSSSSSSLLTSEPPHAPSLQQCSQAALSQAPDSAFESACSTRAGLAPADLSFPAPQARESALFALNSATHTATATLDISKLLSSPTQALQRGPGCLLEHMEEDTAIFFFALFKGEHETAYLGLSQRSSCPSSIAMEPDFSNVVATRVRSPRTFSCSNPSRQSAVHFLKNSLRSLAQPRGVNKLLENQQFGDQRGDVFLCNILVGCDGSSGEPVFTSSVPALLGEGCPDVAALLAQAGRVAPVPMPQEHLLEAACRRPQRASRQVWPATMPHLS